MSSISSQKRLPRAVAIDFFCGAGGVTKGFINAGIHVLAGIDIDNWCEFTYTDPKNNKNRYDGGIPKYLKYDIQKNNIRSGSRNLFSELKSVLKGWEKIPLIFSICSPCQPFSTITKIGLTEQTSKRRDEAKNLLKAIIPYIDKFRPLMIFSENVPGVRSEKRYGPILTNYRDDLKSLGYIVGSDLVNAKYFNVPQNRLRNILIAVHVRHWKEKKSNPPEKVIVPKKHSRFKDFMTVKDVLGTSSDPAFPPLRPGEIDPKIPNHRAANLSSKNRLRIKLVKPGKTNEILAKTNYGDLRVACHQKADRNGNKNHHSDVYTRMDPRKPSPAITTKCHSISNGRYGYPYMSQSRAITPREAAVLQSFPKNYRFHPLDELMQVSKQIGNAVPPKLAEFFGRYFLDHLKQNGN